ncbi:MAG: hypothetical protein AB1Z22_09235 [Synechococcaceae cyanobacterium]
MPVFLPLTSSTPVTHRTSPLLPGQDAPMASSPSATYQRLRHYIAKRMRMSHVYQP